MDSPISLSPSYASSNPVLDRVHKMVEKSSINKRARLIRRLVEMLHNRWNHKRDVDKKPMIR